MYDNKEYLSNGVVKWYWGIDNFDDKKDECWNYLAELYYNMIPDSLTRVQYIYFINLPKENIVMKNMKQIENTEGGLKKVVGIASLDTLKGKIEFKEFPYGKN